MEPLLIHIIANLSPITNLQQVALHRKNGIIVPHVMVQAIVNIVADQAKMHIQEMGVVEFVVVQANVPVAMAKEVGKYKNIKLNSDEKSNRKSNRTGAQRDTGAFRTP